MYLSVDHDGILWVPKGRLPSLSKSHGPFCGFCTSRSRWGVDPCVHHPSVKKGRRAHPVWEHRKSPLNIHEPCTYRRAHLESNSARSKQAFRVIADDKKCKSQKSRPPSRISHFKQYCTNDIRIAAVRRQMESSPTWSLSHLTD